MDNAEKMENNPVEELNADLGNQDEDTEPTGLQFKLNNEAANLNFYNDHKDVIKKVRFVSRYFRKSPVCNPILQKHAVG